MKIASTRFADAVVSSISPLTRNRKPLEWSQEAGYEWILFKFGPLEYAVRSDRDSWTTEYIVTFGSIRIVVAEVEGEKFGFLYI